MKPRIVITGIGVVSPWGAGVQPFWEHLGKGHSSVRSLTNPSLAGLPVQIAAVVPEIPEPETPLSPPPTRTLAMALAAAREAWENARLPAPAQHTCRTALCSAIGWGPYETDDLSRLIQHTSPATDLLARTQAGFSDAALARQFKITGPVFTCLSACAASTQALGRACQLLVSGSADICLAGGADSRIHLLGATGYSLLHALTEKWNHAPEKASRPFDRQRSGFVMGEGAAFFILETLEHAQARNADLGGEILGHASTCDAFRLTDPEPDGSAAAACMKLALQNAGLKTKDIDYINAHGTGTPANDAAEIQAIRSVFGDHSPDIPVSSFKSMFGHLSMASGAIETAGTLLALRHQLLPPTLNCDDPEWPDLNFVPHRPVAFNGRIALKNSFGFGGQNSCLILQASPPHLSE